MELLNRYKMSTNQLKLVWVAAAFWAIAALLISTSGNKVDADFLSHKDTHSVIAITCPYAPFFEWGHEEGVEWQLISEAFRMIGQEPLCLYVSLEEALRLLENQKIAGICSCLPMTTLDNGYYISDPLVKRNFVVVSLAENKVTIEKLKDLTKINLGIHPHVHKVLEPQLKDMLKSSVSIREVPNHLSLSTMLFTGQIDALIVEESVFTHTKDKMPDNVNLNQEIKFHQIFEPVYPRIIFTDENLRNHFNQAWEEVSRRS